MQNRSGKKVTLKCKKTDDKHNVQKTFLRIPNKGKLDKILEWTVEKIISFEPQNKTGSFLLLHSHIMFSTLCM